MPEQTPTAYLVHRVSTRFRLRVPERRGEADYFEQVQQRLSGLTGVEEVRVNPATASILALHPVRPFADLESELGAVQLFRLAAGQIPNRPAFTPLQSGLSSLDRYLRDNSGAGLDLRSLTFIAMVGIALNQIRRGETLGPALPMLWNAFELLATRSK